MVSIYDNEKERRIHENAIHELSEHYRLEEAWLRKIYQAELQSLKVNARVTGYLPVLCCHCVREQLHDMPSEQVSIHRSPPTLIRS